MFDVDFLVCPPKGVLGLLGGAEKGLSAPPSTGTS